MVRKKENIVAIIQARNGSTRLNNKIMKNIAPGVKLIDMVVKRAREASYVDLVVVATTKNSEDDCLVQWCNDNHIEVFRGNEKNVLRRYYGCSTKYNADIIVRITADDPFKDPSVNNEVIKLLIEKRYDYVSNTIIPSFPEGLDVEVFTYTALKYAFENATLDSEKEHVTAYIWKNKDIFKIFNFKNSKDLSHLRWTIDYEEDLEFVRCVCKKLDIGNLFLMKDVLRVLKENPEIMKKQKKVIRNEGYIKSINEDKK
jgi:spore coat polysaccharide biosynthesis protein SpsF (cytidylyltransferase family)